MKNTLFLYFTFIIPSIATEEILSDSYEGRGGIMRHDIKGKLRHRYEKGPNINAELVTPAFWHKMGLVKAHGGVNLNVRRATNQLYAGMTWQGLFWQWLLLEGTFGGEIHDGRLKLRTKRKKALGSRLLFRESVSLGVVWQERHRVLLTLDHGSNARLARPNPGLTSFGIRYGYAL